MRLCNSRRHGEHCAGRHTDPDYLAPVIIDRVGAYQDARQLGVRVANTLVAGLAETTIPIQPVHRGGKHRLAVAS